MQTRLESLIERTVDLVFGIVISTILNVVLIRYYNYPIQWHESFNITIVFTLVSFIRGYIVSDGSMHD